MKSSLLPLINKLIYSIALMNHCIRSRGDAMGLIHDCRWVFILDLPSLYGIEALQRITMAFVRWVLRAMGLHSCRALIATPWAYPAPPFSCSCPCYSRWWCTWTTLSQLATHCTRHLAIDPRPRGGYVFPRETWEGMCHLLSLTDGVSTWFWATWRPMRPIWSPQSPNMGLEMFCSIWRASPSSSWFLRPSLTFLAQEASMLLL